MANASKTGRSGANRRPNESTVAGRPSLASIPRVDAVAAHGALEEARKRLGREIVVRISRGVLDAVRDEVRAGGACPALDEVAARALVVAESALAARARTVINATGVVLHTNLGRAPLGRRAVCALATAAGRYASIELDLPTGSRGARGAFAERALAQVCSAEAALVVNNNAAAVLLCLSALAKGRRVIVSRGELVEIGGGFRVPDVLASSGARLVEVGTTNKVRLDDYRRAVAEAPAETAAILRVHAGNFRQLGFVERPSLPELCCLARECGVLVVKDLGGGALVDLTALGLHGEPVARDCVEAGSDLVCFSTDKVLGGPQGGAIVGRSELVERLRRDPLARALRIGRLPLVALEATLACYLEGDLADVPTLAALRQPVAEVRRRADAWRDALAARGVATDVVDLQVEVGGGTLAGVPLTSAGLALAHADVDRIAARLRAGDPAVAGRIHGGRLLFDARTVLPDEDGALVEAIARAVAP